MTLEDLDKALEKSGLDLTNPMDMEARDRVLFLHGQHILKSKKERCSHCWYGENGKCGDFCDMYGLPDDPIETSKRYLEKPNDIGIFRFFCMFVVPVYEEITGKRDTMKEIYKSYKKLSKQKLKKKSILE